MSVGLEVKNEKLETKKEQVISIKNKHFELELDTINVLEEIGWKYQFQVGMKMNRFIGLDAEKIVNRVYDEKKDSYIKVEPVLVFKKKISIFNYKF